MDYHVNYTVENNLLIKLLYLYEFLLELVVDMSLKTKKNVRTYDNCLSVLNSDDITIDNRISNTVRRTARKEKKKQNDSRNQCLLHFPPTQKANYSGK
jgi:hypothetical protein